MIVVNDKHAVRRMLFASTAPRGMVLDSPQFLAWGENKLRQAEAQRRIRDMGMACTVSSTGEFRVTVHAVSFVAAGYGHMDARERSEACAYYTTDAQDAVDTALLMRNVKHRLEATATTDLSIAEQRAALGCAIMALGWQGTVDAAAVTGAALTGDTWSTLCQLGGFLLDSPLTERTAQAVALAAEDMVRLMGAAPALHKAAGDNSAKAAFALAILAAPDDAR